MGERQFERAIGIRAKVRTLPMPDDNGVEVEALHRAVLEQATRAVELTRSQTAGDIAARPVSRRVSSYVASTSATMRARRAA